MDYYVEGSMAVVSDREGWLVTRTVDHEPLGFFRGIDPALTLARSLAVNKARDGQPSQVHFRLNPRIPWRTVWHAPDCQPRYRTIDVERLKSLLDATVPSLCSQG